MSEMLVIGLTGSVAMGKSEVASMFRRLGVAVFDADAAVDELYRPEGAAVRYIAEAFPGCVSEQGGVDRAALGACVLESREEMDRLEAIVHPLVGEEKRAFLDHARREGRSMAVLDIPLLLETNARHLVDYVVVVSASARFQRERALARPAMTQEKLDGLLARQMPDEAKRRHADFIIDTSRNLDETFDQVRHIVATLLSEPERVSKGKCS
ncbi:MAG: dephospho-CoA kinase [Hyphomicrobiales bacterium]